MITNGRSVTYDISMPKIYTFKVAAATLKGIGPYSPVLSIDPNPGRKTIIAVYCTGYSDYCDILRYTFLG
ncbi:unnamed protein product [Onchocerca flexuosa]|uniref:Fibronectin type-III domain-containing protein n=1 Tax=Onchocerca flexuosa TaxID=387005 RepID=A0A183HUH8_9BILA|nr:unnamed protein product [Onchocerca flexuosa]